MNSDSHPLNPAADAAARARYRAALLRNAGLDQLTPQEIDRVLAFSVARRYRAGEAIFRRGDVGDSMMIVVSGQVKIGLPGPDGREAVLAVLGDGELLGEMAIIDSQPRSADAVALEPSELLVLHRRDCVPFLERNPRVAVQMLRLVCERLRRTSALVEDRLFLRLPARLAKVLLDLAGGGCAPGTQVELRMSQKDFAAVLGVSREALNKQLRAWEDEALVTVRRGRVVIERPDELARLVEA